MHRREGEKEIFFPRFSSTIPPKKLFFGFGKKKTYRLIEGTVFFFYKMKMRIWK